MAETQPTCPMCDVGHLTPERYEDEFDYRGQKLQVADLECYVCNTCGADPVFEDQIRRNHRLVTDAKRRADSLLTGDEIKAMRDDLRLSQKDASELFGGGANAFSKYERGDVMQSVAMDRLIRLTWRSASNLHALRVLAGISLAPEAPAVVPHQGTQRIPLDTRQCRAKRRPDNVIVVEPKVWTGDLAA